MVESGLGLPSPHHFTTPRSRRSVAIASRATSAAVPTLSPLLSLPGPARRASSARHARHRGERGAAGQQRRSAINGQTWLQQRRPRFPRLLALPA